ncbi:hypothetical protein C8R43DRAFT_1119658 [Mycena crocata]|nr:hypothetical protein C8R43DRAFT_1119658 [Mycena crocata]
MYTSPVESQVIDLYNVGIEEPRRASVPFICGIEVEGPRGELERIRALEDGGAMVNAMCVALYRAVRHRIGELQRSGKILRMANGTLVPSIGYWEGYIRFGGARVKASFEVFPSGGSWSFLFGKPLLEAFGANHDYATDTITVPGETGPTVIQNQIGQLSLWDKARGTVNAVFLDPKTRATPAGGISAPPVRRVLFSANCTLKSIDQHQPKDQSDICGEVGAKGVDTEAQGNSTGVLPTPSREVHGVDGEEHDEDTDEIYFTACESMEEDEVGAKEEGEMTEAAHTVNWEENSEDTRVYVPGDFSRSPTRDVQEKICTSQLSSDTDSFLRSEPATSMAQTVRMAAVLVRGGIFALAAQYGGTVSATRTCGTLSGDLNSPPREVPAPEDVFKRALKTDTMVPVIYLEKS